MRASRALVGSALLLAVGCAAGTTDDFFKVGELPEDTTSDGGSGGPSTVSSGGAGSSSDDRSATSSVEAASAADASAQIASIGSTTTTGTGGASDGTGGASEQSASTTGSSDGTGGTASDSVGGTGGTGGTGGSGGTSGADTGGSGGTGGSEEPVIFVHEFEDEDDCVEVQCPEDAPYLVACDITFSSWYDNTFCLALEEERVVFIMSGNTCSSLGSAIAAGSTITCSSEPLEADITTDECETNLQRLDRVDDRCDCSGSFYINGC